VSGHWSDWRPGATAHSLGVEEELMVLGGQRLQLEPAGPRAAEALPPHLRAVVTVETHASALEVHTSVHARVADAAAELAGRRAELAGELEALGLRAASAGTHPLSLGLDTTVSPQDRYQHLYRALGELARREPTFALHGHVGLPTADAALRAYDSLRAAVPLLIGLSANSPFWRGRDSGLASARTFVFGAFPRTGLPRAFASYEDYVEALDALIDAGGIPDHTFVWWDLRLQPHLGTIEIRAMDAQVEVWETAALVAIVQGLVRAGAEEGPGAAPPPEVLDENRFIAARDGVDARLIDDGRLTPLPELLDRLLARLAPHARDMGCVEDLEAAAELGRRNGAARQRRAADELGVTGIAGALADAYASPARHDAIRSGAAPSAG
jgi:carboxylate-amine ligase